MQYATEIKVRAERRCGELLARAKQDGDRHSGHGDQKSESKSTTPKLSDIGLTKDQSSRYQQLAAMPEEHFETAVETAKATAGEVTTAFMLREAKKHRAVGKPMKGKRAYRHPDSIASRIPSAE